ncbi:MAG TPA: MG2 domain-containing protein [Polyangia bacterium]|nr:MG2 domain-containing protein [Polyangia bacterium]
MRKITGRLASIALLVVASCHSRKPGPAPLHVTLRAPETRAAGALGIDEVVTVGFDHPVGGQGAPTDLLRFEPPVAGSARWVDAQTLSFTPKPHWPAATTVLVSLERGLRARDGAILGTSLRWRLRTPEAQIAEVSPSSSYDLRWAARNQAFRTRWTLPIDADTASERCRFLVGERTQAVKAEPAGERTLTLTPKSELPRGADARLVCARANHAADGSPTDYEIPFRTIGDFHLIEHGPRRDGVPADIAQVTLHLSNPVDAEAARKAIQIEPAPGKNLEVRGGWDGQISVEGEFAANVTYTVTLARTLRDRFGQKLDSDYSFRFTTSDSRAALSMQRGLFVVEASSPLYPLWTRNLSAIDVRLARIPENKLVPFLSGVSLYPGTDAPDFEKLALAVRAHHLKTPGRRNRWNEGTLHLGALTGNAARPRGVFYLDAVGSEIEEGRRTLHKAIANVTDLGLTAKLAPAQGLIWVTQLSTGKPVVGAQVVIRDPKNRVRWSGQTGEGGLAVTPGRDKLQPAPPRRGPRTQEEEEEERDDVGWHGDWDAGGQLYVLVSTADDFAFLADRWQPGTAAWSFGVQPDRTPGSTRVRGFLETDRGLYRPGDVVHIKGLVRTLQSGQSLRVPAGEKVHVKVIDPRGDGLLEKDVKTGAFGGFALDLPTAREARLGDYRIEARLRDQPFLVNFSIEEFRPASFQVELHPRKPSYLIGDTLIVDGHAAYFYGAALKDAKLHYSVRRRDRFMRWGGELEPFTFFDRIALEDQGIWGFETSSRSELVHDDDGATDGGGNFRIKLPLDAKDTRGPQDYLVEASVADETGQARQTELVVPAHRSAVYVGVKSPWLAEKGQPFRVALAVTDSEGKRVAASGVEVSLRLRTWECNWMAHYRCEPKDQALTRRTIDVAAAGSFAETEFVVDRPGEVVIAASVKDDQGKLARASSSIYVWGGGDASWRQDDSTHLNLIADKASYKPGETAHLLVQAPYQGTALVTTERGTVVTRRVYDLRGAAQAIDIPLGDRDLPNVYVSVALIKGRTGKGDKERPRFKLGLATLKVVPDSKKLRITVAADRPVYRPGDRVQVKLHVADAAGAPVRSEIALAAADEGVLSLVAYKTPDPLSVFYAPWGLSVETSTSYERFAHRVEPDEDDDGGVGDGGAEDAQGGKVRSKFLPTAYWHPALTTDPSGNVEVSFVAPDQLTAFRLMAVAADAGGDRFGSADAQFRVAKPFALHPVLPRFLTVGDSARIGVVVENDTPAAGRVTVEASGKGIALVGPTRRTVEVPKGARIPVSFEAHAGEIGRASFRFRSALGSERDAVEVTIPVERPTPMETLTVAEGSTRTATTASVVTPATAMPGQGELDVTLDGSGLAGTTEGLRFLIEYPYG